MRYSELSNQENSGKSRDMIELMKRKIMGVGRSVVFVPLGRIAGWIVSAC